MQRKSHNNKRSQKSVEKPPSNRTDTKAKAPPKAGSSTRKRSAKAKPKPPGNEVQYSARPEKFKDTYGRVLAVVSKMRREKVSLTQASRDIGIDPRSVTRWGASALRRGLNGKYSAKKQDSLLRLVLIPTVEGPREIAVRSSKQVKLLAEYWNALHRYLQTGDATKLKTFEGKQIKDANGIAIPLSVDLAALNRLGSAGALSFESIYARTT